LGRGVASARDAIDGTGKEATRKETCLRKSFDEGRGAPTNCMSLAIGIEEDPTMRRDMSFEELMRSVDVERSKP
jgi:hypothetical protein